MGDASVSGFLRTLAVCGVCVYTHSSGVLKQGARMQSFEKKLQLSQLCQKVHRGDQCSLPFYVWEAFLSFESLGLEDLSNFESGGSQGST